MVGFFEDVKSLLLTEAGSTKMESSYKADCKKGSMRKIALRGIFKGSFMGTIQASVYY